MTMIRHLMIPVFLLSVAVAPVAAEDNVRLDRRQNTERQEQQQQQGERVPQRGGWKRGDAPHRHTPDSFSWTARYVGEMGREMQRIRQQEEVIEKQREEIRQLGRSASQTARARQERMLELRRELLKLDKEDFTERFHEGLRKGLQKMKEEIAGNGLENLPRQARTRLESFHENLKELADEEAKFEGIRKYYREQLVAMREQMRDSAEREDLRRERLQREISHLHHRLDRLQDEMKRLDDTEEEPSQEDE